MKGFMHETSMDVFIKAINGFLGRYCLRPTKRSVCWFKSRLMSYKITEKQLQRSGGDGEGLASVLRVENCTMANDLCAAKANCAAYLLHRFFRRRFFASRASSRSLRYRTPGLCASPCSSDRVGSDQLSGMRCCTYLALHPGSSRGTRAPSPPHPDQTFSP